ncbi:92dddceb-38ae-45d2-be9d-c299a8d1f4c0 [Thermothielavioides terrestris]|nr:92dddceb-38ae-45d2-be9d-c299a8d1f4c0 [Thermothielavioides terrestris]
MAGNAASITPSTSASANQSDRSNDQTPPSGPATVGQRTRLTPEQRKDNHVASEQKRRMAIRQSFERICELVPGMAGQARSEGPVLEATVMHVKRLLLERREMIRALEANGVPVEDKLKAPLEALPEGCLDNLENEDPNPEN